MATSQGGETLLGMQETVRCLFHQLFRVHIHSDDGNVNLTGVLPSRSIRA